MRAASEWAWSPDGWSATALMPAAVSEASQRRPLSETSVGSPMTLARPVGMRGPHLLPPANLRRTSETVRPTETP